MLAAGLACGSDDAAPGDGADAAAPTADASTAGGADAADESPDAPDSDARPGFPGGDGPLYDALEPEAQELFDIINEERAAEGVYPVELREDLVCAAQAHSEDDGAAIACEHEGSDGSDFPDRIVGCGGELTAAHFETIACGPGTPRGAVDLWLQSDDGHREAMLGAARRHVGVGVTDTFWVATYHD